MFGIQLYPTPDNIIKKMLEPYFKPKERVVYIDGEPTIKTINVSHKYKILEPSAGSGNIVKYLNTHHSDCEVYCIEIDNNLQSILKDLECKILGSDFLDFDNRLQLDFDLIIMNPPFQSGAKHLLHAWQILQEGDIVCLLNQETISNPYTEERQLLLKLIEDHGSFEELGPVFEDSENTTNVNIALVRLYKKAAEKLFDFQFSSNNNIPDINLNGEDFKQAIATKDLVGNMMLRFDMSLKAYIECVKAWKYLAFCTQGLTPKHGFDWSVDNSENPNPGYQKFSHTLNAGMWALACQELNLEKLMTNRVQKDFNKFKTEQGYLEFNRKNVGELITMLFENQNLILSSAITDVFDIFTAYHKENRLHIEGWKTNDRWKVNRKIILPNWFKYGEYMTSYDLKEYGDTMKTNYSYHSEYADIDKVLCFISGKKYDEIYKLKNALEDKFKEIGKIKTGDKFDNTGQSTFFNFKFFRKGSLHIEFIDEKLWTEFNLRACKGKNWLPQAEEDAWKKSKQQPTEDMFGPEKQQSQYQPHPQQLQLL